MFRRCAALASAFLVWGCCLAHVQAQTPAAEPAAAAAAETDSAEVNIVDGNVVGAKKRALEEAFLRAVERVFAAELTDAGMTTTALPASLLTLQTTFPTGARRYIRSYRVVEETEANGKLLMRVAADVDRVFLRRQIEKARSVALAPTPNAVLPVEVVMTQGPPELATAMADALRSSGLVVQALPAGAAGRPEAARVVFRGSVRVEGEVRGSGLLGTRCQVDMAVRRAKATSDTSPPAAVEWGFAAQAPAAAKACLDRMAPAAANSVLAMLTQSTATRKAVTVLLDIVEPAALERFMRKLPRVGTLSHFELRRIAVGVAEVRVETNLTAKALGDNLAAAMSEQLTVAVTQSAGDLLHLTLRVRTDADASPTFEEESAPGQ